MVDGLDPDNLTAWRTYGQLNAHRWIWDAQCGAWWLGELFKDMDPDERDERMARVDVIYDVLHPPKAKAHGA